MVYPGRLTLSLSAGSYIMFWNMNENIFADVDVKKFVSWFIGMMTILEQCSIA